MVENLICMQRPGLEMSVTIVRCSKVTPQFDPGWLHPHHVVRVIQDGIKQGCSHLDVQTNRNCISGALAVHTI